MLFSNKEVSTYINEHFEPVWESVRAVPIVTIDFGGGKLIKRTLHGNIATYVCTAEGYVVDVLPGIYQPTTYISELATLAERQAQLPTDQSQAARAMHDYRTRSVLQHPANAGNATRIAKVSSLKDVAFNEPVAGLSKDTELNETIRRDAIHSKLASCGLVKPDEVKHWLYKTVLHADLDDPYLGLGPTLNATYPFQD